MLMTLLYDSHGTIILWQVNSVDAPAQFITTTFRPELVEVANNCYGIALINKVSNIYPLDKVGRLCNYPTADLGNHSML